MDFSDALVYLKNGSRIGRSYWGLGKVLFIENAEGRKRICFLNSVGSTGVWIPIGIDILAEDWVVEDTKVISKEGAI